VENGLLVCVTEVNTRQEIDRLVEALARVDGERRA
jgi:glycine cleavage system protein P-like pyridoxal-binding family